MADDLESTPTNASRQAEALSLRAERCRQAAAAAAPTARRVLEDMAADYDRQASLMEKWGR